MPVQYYLPTKESDLVMWFNNWAAKMQTFGTTIGLSAAEKTQANVDAGLVSSLINTILSQKAFLSDLVAYKDLVISGPLNTPLPAFPTAPEMPVPAVGALAAILKRTQQLNERARNHPSYTEAIGRDLGIIGPEVEEPTAPASVVGTAVPGSDVRIAFSKGLFAGVVVYSKRGTETTFTELAVDTNTPYVDTREPLVAGQPETRTYKLRLYDGDAPVGDYSDEVSVVTVP